MRQASYIQHYNKNRDGSPVNTKPLIYVIDDEVDISNLVCQELERYNFDTQAFTTGEQALLAIKEQLPALCIIDLGLPYSAIPEYSCAMLFSAVCRLNTP